MKFTLLVALLIIAAPASASVGHRADPKALVLQLSDLPNGFGRDSGRYVTNAQLDAERTTHKDFRKLGRLSGYYTSYSAIAVGGVTEVSSFASIYKLGTGAHASLVQSLSQAEGEGGLELIPAAGLSRLGTDARLFRQRASQNGTAVDFYTVVWRDGTVFAEVMGAGRAGTVDPDQVVALAKKQATRIARLTS
ncbi:MAG: hypothetical protein JO186_09175 [Actinobacteria bacterium]|nr:hypothetical protein [Actinomycetota bacterium]MBV8397082.1 hypothetical protein [Actinomycetota bacterium]MBV8599587.1 hypothetical protein [Actinomycetota bacterium]